MAIHHLTLPVRGGERPLLPSTQVGPVTQAIRTMREADPADRAIAAIQNGCAAHFADAYRQRIRDLRRRIAERIEADIAILDALDGDCDLEDGYDAEGLTDDNGIGDTWAAAEQGFRGYGRCE